MPALVDTSVWIRALGRAPRDAALRATLDGLLEQESVVAHPLIYGELLMGDAGGRTAVLQRYTLLPGGAPVAHDAVVAFVRHHRLMGRGVGWIDCHLLAAAVRDRVGLWTVDQPLARVAHALACAFDAS